MRRKEFLSRTGFLSRAQLSRTAWLSAGIILSITIAMAGLDDTPFEPDLDDPAIGYSLRPLQDPVTELNRKLLQGTAELRYQGRQGYLRSVLDALRVPAESQMVVFSKTSLQQDLIEPRNPRALYFNDSVAVGWVPGEPFVELAAQDPQQGIVFYTLDQKPSQKPQFVRQTDCLDCHVSYATLGVPGFLARSVYPSSDGDPVYPAGSYVTDDRSPFDQRWGGWYVTGSIGAMRHMGNAILTDPDQPGAMVTAKTLHVASLRGKFDTSMLLSPYSDVVALMVFDHQVRMVNLLTRVGWEVRVAQRRGDPHALATLLQEAAQELVDEMLFIDQPPLPGPLHGSSGFAEKFAAEGPRDRRGRSLRELDLSGGSHAQLMRYPLSYMIYSPAFDGLPAEARDAVYQRLWQVLSGSENSGKYAGLTRADRQAVVEILRDTKPGLPEYFSAAVE
jgi:hypothetical protein